MKIVRWEPFGEFGTLRPVVERLSEDSVPLHRRGEDFAGVPVDVIETEQEVMVKALLPGVKADAFEVSVLGETLSIRGETSQEEATEKVTYLRREIRTGAFSRVITLPCAVRAEEARADFVDGLLTVTLPKAEQARARATQVGTFAEPVAPGTNGHH